MTAFDILFNPLRVDHPFGKFYNYLCTLKQFMNQIELNGTL